MTDQHTLTKLDIWHPGEKAIQTAVGVSDYMDELGKRIVRDYMPAQHRDFYAQIPFIAVGSVDASGDAWAMLAVGKPGFISSPTEHALDIDVARDPSDPASEGMREGNAIGILGIGFDTRRRNRVNGLIGHSLNGALHFEVDQSFGNCPRYIALRDYEFARDPKEIFAGDVEDKTALDAHAREMIETADMFFVASYAEREDRRQVDVSSRGGKAGFVRVAEDGTLTIPDFAGNLFFATLGNILLNGKAGLMFADYETGDVLQVTGDATVVLESPEIAAFQGAERLWTFKPRRVVFRRGVLALRWIARKDGESPASLMTGNWQQTDARLKAAELANTWRPFKVTDIVEESASIRSFHLQPADGVGLLHHDAGQYLPIRVTVDGADKPVIRTYTLSVAPSDDFYRISVKRDGLVSQWLHDHVKLGDIIEARGPAGDFTIDPAQERPAVLLAGGIGITPMLAMLRHVVYEGKRVQKVRPTVVVQAARSKADRAFLNELHDLEEAAGGAVRILRVLSDVSDAEEGADYDAAGRIDAALLSRFMPIADYDFYLCGPPPFMQAIYDELRASKIPDARIHAEAFGPASMIRKVDGPALAPARRPPSSVPVHVVFTDSMKEATWAPGSGTLLELAEARGLSPDYSCRAGNCGTCKAMLLAGDVTYTTEPSIELADNEVLICCAVPAGHDDRTSGDQDASRIHIAI
ncbi:2Fe-2S iron-sulfur cluster binding domain-containing protein [Tardiphaga alba]|uniref:2Fe-2S iron-sulfur cluster binding domain-containing protein n=1 Tax=Tardiphaga alba TaxID=340268 RepID=A0ABX8A3X7_9BRAD|nr:pyridoxamine 5'-phosphate oxidase family protein [Tardiphaga alba]QUS38187.1 2Fe-2S iron-sulfur cluster binding domain-containing protein [Tardiphaga alba]